MEGGQNHKALQRSRRYSCPPAAALKAFPSAAKLDLTTLEILLLLKRTMFARDGPDNAASVEMKCTWPSWARELERLFPDGPVRWLCRLTRRTFKGRCILQDMFGSTTQLQHTQQGRLGWMAQSSMNLSSGTSSSTKTRHTSGDQLSRKSSAPLMTCRAKPLV